MSLDASDIADKSLKHIAIIMDGNGRWAEEKGMSRSKGHLEGVDSLREVVKSALKLGVRHLTVFAFSTENWLRPKSEVNFLFNLMKSSIENNICKLKEQSIKLNFIGDIQGVPDYLQKAINFAEEQTSTCDKLTVNIAINYGGRWDIVNACKEVVKDFSSGNISVEDINEGTFSNYLSIKDAQEVDLFIRTSGEQRISNFVLWYISYSEMFFSDKYWPDFKSADFEAASNWFHSRNRRFGAAS